MQKIPVNQSSTTYFCATARQRLLYISKESINNSEFQLSKLCKQQWRSLQFLFEIFSAYLYHLGLPAPIKRFASFSPQIFDDSAHTKSSAAGALYPPSAPARHRDKDYAELCTFTAEKEVPINFSCKSRQSRVLKSHD